MVLPNMLNSLQVIFIFNYILCDKPQSWDCINDEGDHIFEIFKDLMQVEDNQGNHKH